ncbi:MAG TPA: DUF3298 and DUF4163 domain-containing protein [Clostridiales bacterium]|nr:DUF3298 and DUF4163 domain-containing protein [Clostridiales bacterium]
MKGNTILINILMMAVIFVLAFSFVAVLRHTLADNNIFAEVASETSLKITEKQIKETKGNLDMEFSIPVIEGLADKEIQSSINSMLENDIESFRKYMIELSATDTDSSINMKYIAKTSYKINKKSRNLLSISVIYYQDTGGAHGIYDMVAYNFDIRNGSLLELDDLFENKDGYKDIINEEIRRQICENKGKIEYFSGDSGFKSISSHQPFYINDGKLVIYFSLYEIAPYSSGIPGFEIPFTLFEENLNEIIAQ